MDWNDGWTLRDYVRSLLLDGKGPDHPDFQVIMPLFGHDRIKAMIKDLFEEEARKASRSEPEPTDAASLLEMLK